MLLQISSVAFLPHSIIVTLILTYSPSFPVPHLVAAAKWDKVNKGETSKYTPIHFNMS